MLFELDDDDRIAVEDVSTLKSSGLYFQLDGTALWIDAMNTGRGLLSQTMPHIADMSVQDFEELDLPGHYFAQMGSTQLGALVTWLQTNSLISGCGLALLDGGISSVFEGTPEECAQNIMRSVLLPWDLSPNHLYVWQ